MPKPVPNSAPAADEGAPPAAAPASPLAALADQVEREAGEALRDATDADVGGIPEQEPQPVIPNSVRVAGLIRAVRASVCMIAGLEAPKRTLTDDKVDKLGEIWGGVLDEYKINLSDHMGKFGPVIAAVMVSLPLVEDTWTETRKEIAEKDGKRPALPAPAPGPQPVVPAPAANNPGYKEGVVQPRWTP